MTRSPLLQRFFRRRADEVARDLLGASIRSTVAGHEVEGLIIETEAYLGFDDPASHGYRGRRHAGNANLYAPPGTWYVYRSYGIHWCANLVCGGPGGSAVLLRGVLPLRGLAIMRKRRGGVAVEVLANGPGKLCQALGITRELDGVPMRRSAVLVSEASDPAGDSVAITPRIGITKAVDWPLRFVLVPPALHIFPRAPQREAESAEQRVAGAAQQIARPRRSADLVLAKGC